MNSQAFSIVKMKFKFFLAPNRAPLIKKTITSKLSRSAAMFAVAQGDLSTLNILIEEGIDLNIANSDGITPLMKAASQVIIFLRGLLPSITYTRQRLY